jgi:hypothetical protein
MTDDEFERIKEAEKDRVREQKRVRAVLRALKRRYRAASVLERMKQGVQGLFRTHRRGMEALRSATASEEARLEVWVDVQEEPSERAEDEEALREARADKLLRQYKAAVASTDVEKTDSAERDEDSGPDKTIGRMNPSGPDEESTR